MTRILVIEDEMILRREVVEWLKLEGYEAVGAADGEQGIEQAFRLLPDLIICDITMPRLDGYGVLLELRAHPSTAAIPFIFVTARASQDDVRYGMGLGADDYITKPFTRLDFFKAIESRLHRKTVSEEQHRAEVEQWRQAFEQEHEQRLLKAKLVAMFSHDFRNPLASILSSNGLLRDYADRMDESRRFVHFNRIEASVMQLLQMLEDMLIVSQMESGHLEFTPEPMNITDFLKKIVEEFQIINAETHRVTFESRVSQKIPGDSRLLRQISANLISNAIKYSPQDSEVHVSLDKDAAQVMLTVRDHGVGIPENDQGRLFQAFQRGSNVGEILGTGLGLAIVKQAVEAHGGSIHLHSEVNYGTTVKVRLPA